MLTNYELSRLIWLCDSKINSLHSYIEHEDLEKDSDRLEELKEIREDIEFYNELSNKLKHHREVSNKRPMP